MANQKLLQAVQRPVTRTVEYEGCELTLHAPTGADAVNYLLDVKGLDEVRSQSLKDKQAALPTGEVDELTEEQHAELAAFRASLTPEERKEADHFEQETMLLVSRWLPVLLEPEGLTEQDSWRAFTVMGGFHGPVPTAMFELVGEAAGLDGARAKQVPS